MNKKENVTLVKGFELKENGHLFCREYDFGLASEIIGKTFDLNIPDTELELCAKGFHACDNIGKVKCFYDEGVYFNILVETAYFEDAEKYVFSKFTVLSELVIRTGNYNTGDYNTGDYNTGDYNTGNCNTRDCNTGNSNTGSKNTGDYNTGNYNTGDRNTGYRNTGDYNTGNYNTGHRNTGYRNTGDDNTGDDNTGDDNTGHGNTGHGNTGYRNTGNWNTGDWNLTNNSAGFFAIKEPKAYCFDEITNYTVSEFRVKFNLILNRVPTYENLIKLPNATEEKVNAYLKRYAEVKK